MTAETAVDTPPAGEPAPPPNGARFLGDEQAFWRLLIRGAVLLLVTLGIYRFWLATDVRRSLWNNTEIAGDYLEYIGTARELLLGFLIAIALLVPINVVFFLATLSSGVIGQIAGALALVALGGCSASSRSTARGAIGSPRTVYRGIRFHQTGSAWRYAVCAIFWWAMIALTLGLAYPWAQASLERFKLRNTYYGDLQGQFVGSGTRLFFRGVAALARGGRAVPARARRGDRSGRLGCGRRGDAARRRRRHGPDRGGRASGPALVVAVLSFGWSVIAVALLYPAFQAMVLRWWISGLRFGDVDRHVAALRTRRGLSPLSAASCGSRCSPASSLGIGGRHRASRSSGRSEAWLGEGHAHRAAADRDPDRRLRDRCARLFDHLPSDGEIAAVEAGLRVDRACRHRGARPASRRRGATGSPVGEGLADALNVGGI